MSLLTSPEQDFADIEQRLRSTYAHVANEFVPENQEPSVVSLRTIDSATSKRRRFGIWKPRIATLGAVAGMAFAGFNLANRNSTTTRATASPSAFKSFPHLILTAPTGYHFDSLSRQLTPQILGYRTEYRAASGRLPMPCRCESVTFSPNSSGEVRVVDGRSVMLAPEKGPDGIVMQRRTVIWAPTSTAMVRLDSPVSWDWTQMEAVIRGVKEVDQATFTALLESNGIREVSLLP